MSFINKVVLITGSGSGIGATTAVLFAKEGAHVVIVDKNEDGAKDVEKECEKFTKKVLVITADITKDEETKNIVKKTIDTFGKLHILVNNAGIVRGGSILDGTILENFDEIMKVNLRAVVAMTCSSAKHLVESKGCIVNISSMASILAKVGIPYPAYALSKAGVNAFTQISALEFASSGVRVNAILPGPVMPKNGKQPIAQADMEMMESYLKALALRKFADPDEIGDLILYLASDKAKSITGSCYNIDNGMMLM